MLIIVASFFYIFIACIVFGIAITIPEFKDPLWFSIIMSLLWPITVAIGIGVSAAKENSTAYDDDDYHSY